MSRKGRICRKKRIPLKKKEVYVSVNKLHCNNDFAVYRNYSNITYAKKNNYCRIIFCKGRLSLINLRYENSQNAIFLH